MAHNGSQAGGPPRFGGETPFAKAAARWRRAADDIDVKLASGRPYTGLQHSPTLRDCAREIEGYLTDLLYTVSRQTGTHTPGRRTA